MRFRTIFSALLCSILGGIFALNAAYAASRATGAFSPDVLQTRPSSLGPGQWSQGHYVGSTGARDFYVYVPLSAKNRGPLPMMVMLHGCSQGAETLAGDTGMNLIAEKYGFVVVYPEQSLQANPSVCWNWFDPESQRRGGGELAIVIGIMQTVAQSIAIDRSHVYAAGLSAGAAMASNLIACYADVFAGAGIASGLDYKAASSQTEAFMAMSMGPTSQNIQVSARDAVRCTGVRANPVAILNIHGSADPYVKTVNSAKIVEQFTAINDLLDDGQSNHSQNLNPILNLNGLVPNGYRYSFSLYGGNSGAHVGKIFVEGMSHAWSGAPRSGQFADPKGPNFSEMLWQFMMKYSIPR